MRQIDRNLKGVQKAWKLGPAAVRDERAPECSKQQKLTGIVTIYNWLYTYIYISLSLALIIRHHFFFPFSEESIARVLSAHVFEHGLVC